MANVARKMKLNRNFTLDSTFGHSIRFTKDEEVGVPPILWAQALAIGAEFTDGAVAIEEAKSGPVEPTEPVERATKFAEIIQRLIDKNDFDDFNAAGVPKEAAMSREFGWRVYAKEIKTALQVYYDAKAAERLNG